MGFKSSVANAVINGVKRSDGCAATRQLFEVIYQSRRGDAQGRCRQAHRVLNSVLPHFLKYSTRDSPVYRRGANTQIANHHAA